MGVLASMVFKDQTWHFQGNQNDHICRQSSFVRGTALHGLRKESEYDKVNQQS